ncbi:MAG TPA: DedA family protein [Candidatus Paceibacterota bacterium]|nr:DedA family protein [Candidatus Paceibacterota bacterium]
MDSVHILNQLVENHQIWAYLVIFIGLILEGEVVVITAGVLSYLGALDFTTALIFILAGGVAKSFGCYYLGTLLYKKYQEHRAFKYLERRVLYFMPNFKDRPFWSIFISKFIAGANYVVCIFSGYQKICFRTYIKAELLSTIIWAPLLLSLGYFFSQTALSLSDEIGKFSLVVVGFMIVFILFDKLIATMFRIFQYAKHVTDGIHNGYKK